MNALLSIAGTMSFALVILAILVVIYLRTAGTHTRRMMEEQARLSKKMGMADDSTGSSPAGLSIPARAAGLIKRLNLIALLIGVVLVGFLWWLYQSDLTVTKLSELVWGRPLFYLVLTAVITGLVSWLLPKTWWVPAAVLAFFLAAHPASLLVAHWTTKSSSRASRSIVMPPLGYSNHVVPPVGYAVHYKGHGYAIHVVYADGHECVVGTGTCTDGDIVYTYLQNTTHETNVATYEFVRGPLHPY